MIWNWCASACGATTTGSVAVGCGSDVIVNAPAGVLSMEMSLIWSGPLPTLPTWMYAPVSGRTFTWLFEVTMR